MLFLSLPVVLFPQTQAGAGDRDTSKGNWCKQRAQRCLRKSLESWKVTGRTYSIHFVKPRGRGEASQGLRDRHWVMWRDGCRLGREDNDVHLESLIREVSAVSGQ